MKKLNHDGKLNVDVIFAILTEEKPNQKEKMTIRKERIGNFFPQCCQQMARQGQRYGLKVNKVKINEMSSRKS